MSKQLLLFIPAILLILATCAAGSRQGNEHEAAGVLIKKDPIENFWKWFRANEKRLRNFEDDPGAYLNEMLEQAKKIRPGLAIELEPPKNGVIRMTVSADGNEDLFEIVRQVVSKAPAIRGWTFIAFRQRMTPEQLSGIKLRAQNHELDPGQMKFFPIVNGDTLDLIIYAKGITEENYNQVAYGGLLLLDNILGEYDAVKKVHSYDFHDMPVTKEELEGLLPLLELAAHVDAFHRAKK